MGCREFQSSDDNKKCSSLPIMLNNNNKNKIDAQFSTFTTVSNVTTPQRTGPGTLLKTAHTNITKSILLKFLCNWDLQISGHKDVLKLSKIIVTNAEQNIKKFTDPYHKIF